MAKIQEFENEKEWFALKALSETERHDLSKKLEDLIIGKEIINQDITQSQYSSPVLSDVSSETNLENVKNNQSSYVNSGWTALTSTNEDQLHGTGIDWVSLKVNNMQDVYRPEPIGVEKSNNDNLNLLPVFLKNIDDKSGIEQSHSTSSSQLSSIQYQGLEITKSPEFEAPSSQKIALSPPISSLSTDYPTKVTLNKDNKFNTLQTKRIKDFTDIESFQKTFQPVNKIYSPVFSPTTHSDTMLSSYNTSSSFMNLSLLNKRNNINDFLSEQDVDHAQASTVHFSKSLKENRGGTNLLVSKQESEISPALATLNILIHPDTSLQTLSMTSDPLDKSNDKEVETVLSDSGLSRKQWNKINFENKEISIASTSSFISSKNSNAYQSSEEKSTSSPSMNSSNLNAAMQFSWNSEKQQLHANIPFKSPFSLSHKNKNKYLTYTRDPIIEQIAHRINNSSENRTNAHIEHLMSVDKDSTNSKSIGSQVDYKIVNPFTRKSLNAVEQQVSNRRTSLESAGTPLKNNNLQNNILNDTLKQTQKSEVPLISKSSDEKQTPLRNSRLVSSINPTKKEGSLNQLWSDFQASKVLKTSCSSSQIISKLEALQKILVQQKHAMQSLTDSHVMTSPESTESISRSILSPEFVTSFPKKMILKDKQINNVCPYCSKHDKGTNIPSFKESTSSGAFEEPLTLQMWTQTSRIAGQEHFFENVEVNGKLNHRKMLETERKEDSWKTQKSKDFKMQRLVYTSSKNENYNSFFINKKPVYTAWFQSVYSDVSDIPLCKVPTFHVPSSDTSTSKSVELQRVDVTQLNLQEAFRQHKKRFINNSKKRVQNVKDHCLEKKHRKKWFANKKSSSPAPMTKPDKQRPATNKQNIEKRLNLPLPVGFQQLEQERIACLRANRLKMKQYDMKIRQRYLSHGHNIKSFRRIIQR